jgi:hypothetical protein
MRGGVDVEVQLVTFLAVGGIGDELGAVGHLDLDLVVVGMEIGIVLHGCARNSSPAGEKPVQPGKLAFGAASIVEMRQPHKLPARRAARLDAT